MRGWRLGGGWRVLTMASEQQIAANRKNAIKSTGPKTRAGKQRASGNAYRHGLSIQIDHGEDPEALVSLVWRIAGNTTDQNLSFRPHRGARPLGARPHPP